MNIFFDHEIDSFNKLFALSKQKAIPFVAIMQNQSKTKFTVKGDCFTAKLDSNNERFTRSAINLATKIMIEDWRRWNFPRNASPSISHEIPEFIVNRKDAAIRISGILNNPLSHSSLETVNADSLRKSFFSPTAKDFLYCVQTRKISDVFSEGLKTSVNLPYQRCRASLFWIELSELVSDRLAWSSDAVSRNRNGAFYGQINGIWHIIPDSEVLILCQNFTQNFTRHAGFLSGFKLQIMSNIDAWDFLKAFD